ncbi:MAG: YidC/Oxa1 family membrane protein insertase, partial [bacterium]|nr:YidC/Oxa1 family membrane protein insertase [bacterium]
PLFNAVILIYLYLPGQDFGLAVIILTLLIKLVLYPLGVQAIRSQKGLSQLQPRMKEIQEKFKNDKEQQSKAMMEFYKKEKINPFSGCLPLLIQFPLLIGLYQVFWKGFGETQLKFLYSFVPNPGQIDMSFLGIMDLGQASIVLAVLTGVAQFFQGKMMEAKQKSPAGSSDMSQMMQKQMIYFLPIFTVFILWRLPAAVALYWLTTTLFTIAQQYIILKKHDSPRI